MAVVLSLKKGKKVNLNKLARSVAILEGGKQQLSIAQVSEVQRHVLDELGKEYQENPRGVVELLRRRVAVGKPSRVPR